MAIITLTGPIQRQTAHKAIDDAPDGYVVKIEEPRKRRIQEEKYHAMIGDIARQAEFMGQKWSADDWKRFLIDAFARYMRELGTPLTHDGRIVPNLDGTGVVQLGAQSRKFRKREAADFIEFLMAFGAERDIIWSDRFSADDEAYHDAMGGRQ